jgi:hypothetical protein
MPITCTSGQVPLPLLDDHRLKRARPSTPMATLPAASVTWCRMNVGHGPPWGCLEYGVTEGVMIPSFEAVAGMVAVIDFSSFRAGDVLTAARRLDQLGHRGPLTRRPSQRICSPFPFLEQRAHARSSLGHR